MIFRFSIWLSKAYSKPLCVKMKHIFLVSIVPVDGSSGRNRSFYIYVNSPNETKMSFWRNLPQWALLDCIISIISSVSGDGDFIMAFPLQRLFLFWSELSTRHFKGHPSHCRQAWVSAGRKTRVDGNWTYEYSLPEGFKISRFKSSCGHGAIQEHLQCIAVDSSHNIDVLFDNIQSQSTENDEGDCEKIPRKSCKVRSAGSKYKPGYSCAPWDKTRRKPCWSVRYLCQYDGNNEPWTSASRGQHPSVSHPDTTQVVSANNRLLPQRDLAEDGPRESPWSRKHVDKTSDPGCYRW